MLIKSRNFPDNPYNKQVTKLNWLKLSSALLIFYKMSSNPKFDGHWLPIDITCIDQMFLQTQACAELLFLEFL